MKLGALCATSWSLFQSSLVFLKIGFLFFGGGFLLIPILNRELVTHLQWLSPREFVDGVAMSQLTPGPVAILATFCGYRQGGVLGAILATMLIFLPAFVLMVVLARMYARFEQFPSVRTIMGVFPAAIVGLLAATALDLGRPVMVSPIHLVGAIAALVALVWLRVPPALLIVVGAIVGMVTGG